MKSLKLVVLSIFLYSSSQAQDVQGAWVRDLDTVIQYMEIGTTKGKALRVSPSTKYGKDSTRNN